MSDRETSHSVDDDAALWAARMDRGALSPSDEAALEAWLDGDARRPGALLRAQAVALRSRSARALGPGYDERAFEPAADSRISRRRAMTAGAVAAGLVAAVGVGMLATAPRAYATERGEIRHIPLEDGSVMILNTATKVAVRFDGRSRRVRLIEGEVLFRAARDLRPFVVEAGGERLTTSGAAFVVRKLGDERVGVLVHDGRLEASGNERPDVPPVALAASTRLSPAGRAEPVAAEDLARETAWRDGKIAFKGETLAEAAAAFARYSDTRIVIGDPGLAREPVAGLFAATDPVGFARAVGEIFDVEVVADRRQVLLKARATAG